MYACMCVCDDWWEDRAEEEEGIAVHDTIGIVEALATTTAHLHLRRNSLVGYTRADCMCELRVSVCVWFISLSFVLVLARACSPEKWCVEQLLS